MHDQLLKCQNCDNPFVYSAYEQLQDQKSSKQTPKYCLICTSIKASEQKHPPKPLKSLTNQ